MSKLRNESFFHAWIAAGTLAALVGCGARTGLLSADDGHGGSGNGGSAGSPGTGGTMTPTPTTTTPTPTEPGVCAPLCNGKCEVQILASDQTLLWAMALDEGSVYWVDGWLSADTNRLNRIAKGGGLLQTLVPNLVKGAGVVVAAGNAYFTELGASQMKPEGTVRRMPAGGGPIELVAGSQDGPVPIVADAKNVYWSDTSAGTLWRATLDNTEVQNLGYVGELVRFLAVDDIALYFTIGDSQGGYVGSIPKTGVGDVILIMADDLVDPRGIAVDGNDIYFTEFNDSLRHATLDGGGGSVALVKQGGVSNPVAVDSVAVYYFANGGLYRYCRDGSASPELLAETFGGYSLAVDASAVYFDNGNSLAKIAK